MRCQVTMSCFSSRRASTILRRIGAGSAACMNARTSSRNAISSGVKRRSMTGLSWSDRGRPARSFPLPRFAGEDRGRAGRPRSQRSIYFEQARCAHAAADAHGHDRALGAAAPSFDQGMAGHARTAHAKGVADGDRSAIDIETFLRDAEPVAAIEHLAGEGFVKLPQIDVVDIEALARQQLRNREYRADAHLVG